MVPAPARPADLGACLVKALVILETIGACASVRGGLGSPAGAKRCLATLEPRPGARTGSVERTKRVNECSETYPSRCRRRCMPPQLPPPRAPLRQPAPMNSAPGPSAFLPRCTIYSTSGLDCSSGSTATPGISLRAGRQIAGERLRGNVRRAHVAACWVRLCVGARHCKQEKSANLMLAGRLAGQLQHRVSPAPSAVRAAAGTSSSSITRC